jgi:hypothetical protein
MWPSLVIHFFVSTVLVFAILSDSWIDVVSSGSDGLSFRISEFGVSHYHATKTSSLQQHLLVKKKSLGKDNRVEIRIEIAIAKC